MVTIEKKQVRGNLHLPLEPLFLLRVLFRLRPRLRGEAPLAHLFGKKGGGAGLLAGRGRRRLALAVGGGRRLGIRRTGLGPKE